MASVRKRVLPSGEVRWLVDYKDQTGKRRAKMFETKKTATEFETKARSEVRDGIHVADSATATLADACRFWLERAEAEGLEAATSKQYGEHTRLHILPLLGGETKLSKISKPTVEKFRDEMIATRSRALARKVLVSLRSILTEAQRRGLVGQNVAVGTKVTLSKRTATEVVIPSKVQIRALIQKANEWEITKPVITRTGEKKIMPLPWRPLIILAIFSGLRSSELRGLPWRCVDLQQGLLRVEQRADFKGQIGPPKSGAGFRTVPLAPIAINALKQWKLACPPSALDLVFPNSDGLPISNITIHRSAWRPLQKAAGLVEDGGQDGKGNPIERPSFNLHCLRHAFASLMIDMGWPVKRLQVAMGHSSPMMTLGTYSHLFQNPEDDRETMKRLEARLLG